MVAIKTKNALNEARKTCNTIKEVAEVCDKYKVSLRDRRAICGYMRDFFIRKQLHEVFENRDKDILD